MAWVRSLVAVVATCIIVGPFAAPAATQPACSGVIVQDEWAKILAPTFPDGEAAEMAHFAVDPRRPERLYITNGKTLMASRDGGCSFEQVFTLDLLPDLGLDTSSALAKITQVMVPEEAGENDNVYLVVEEKVEVKDPTSQEGGTLVSASLRPHIVVSRDAGQTWEAADSGLPPAGDAYMLRAAPSDGDYLYALIGGPAGGLYASRNGGGSWEQRGAPGTAGFEIDPQNPEEIWTYRSLVQHSLDGGRNFSVINYVPQANALDVFRAPGGQSQVMAFDPDGGVWWVTNDSGRTWIPIGSPSTPAISIAHGNEADDVITSYHGSVYRFQPPRYWTEITPGLLQGVESEELLDLAHLQVTRTKEPVAFGLTPFFLQRYSGLSVDLPPLEPTAPPAKGAVDFTPATKKIRIPFGEERKVNFKLSLPPQPTPLDVFFLMDTTQSMESSINGLLQGIHRITDELSKADIDVAFGVGEYKDYPIPGYGSPLEGDFPYRLNRGIGPADASLVTALEQMQASGGGTIVEESQLTALHQAATGEGEPGCVPEAAPQCVPPGQDAGFRPGSLKVMINITDAGFEKSPQHPSPPFDVVARELRARDILQVGLAVYGPYGLAKARADLEAMAQQTDTLAPPGGVDCDGDGAQDVAPGGPLVCDITDEESAGVASLAPAIVATLKAIVDNAPVELVTTKGDAFVKAMEPAAYPNVDVKDPQVLGFAVTFGCPPTKALLRGPVELIPTVRGEGVAASNLSVVCEPPVKVKPKKVQPPAPPPPPGLVEAPIPAIVPPPAPPAPPAPVSNAQPQPNAHLQAAGAQQEQEEAQLAVVTSTSEDLDEQYEFASLRERRVEPGVLLLYGTAAAMALGMAGLRLSLRHRLSAAEARRMHHRRRRR